MIKAADAVQTKTSETADTRIDALAAALGYRFEGGVYVSTPRIKRKYVRKVAAAPRVMKKNGLRSFFPADFYPRLEAMAVGEQLDITGIVRDTRVTFKQARSRIDTWAWNYRQLHPTRSYSVSRESWHIIVRRTA